MPGRICPACAQSGRPAIHKGPGLYCAGHKRGTRQARGYDRGHEQARAAAIAAYIPGQPCAIGREQLTGDPALLDLAHNATRTGWLGLACRQHNRGRHEPVIA